MNTHSDYVKIVCILILDAGIYRIKDLHRKFSSYRCLMPIKEPILYQLLLAILRQTVSFDNTSVFN